MNLSIIIGTYSVPVIIAICGFIILTHGKDIGNEFVNGCKDALNVTLDLLPVFIMLMCGTKMFMASGALSFISNAIGNITSLIGIPKDIIPVVIMRPISGSGATAMINALFENSGPDSFAGRCASIIMGSSDTILYTLSMYFASVGIKKTRYAFPAAFINLFLCVIIAVLLTKITY